MEISSNNGLYGAILVLAIAILVFLINLWVLSREKDN